MKQTFMGIIALGLSCIVPIPVTAEESATRIEGKDGSEMALIAAGSFMMGTDDEDLKAIAPTHEVYLDAFYMDIHEVTNHRFARFLNDVRPQDGISARRWQWVVLRSDLDYEEREGWWPTEILFEQDMYTAFPGFENYPVISVSWEAASEYCRWAGKRLPTEAEWEKAARGGLKHKDFPWGDAIPTGRGIVFARKWAHNDSPPPTEPVGIFNSNGYGLFDMAGNVWEWCSDWFDPEYYPVSPLKNPRGALSGSQKVVRGGSWYNAEMVLRVALRNSNFPNALDESTGFRCAKDVEGPRE